MPAIKKIQEIERKFRYYHNHNGSYIHGTPDRKSPVVVSYEIIKPSISRYDLEGNISTVQENLESVKQQLEVAGYTDISLDLSTIDKYGDTEISVKLVANKVETKEEALARVENFKAEKDKREKEKEEAELLLLKKLTAKYKDQTKTE